MADKNRSSLHPLNVVPLADTKNRLPIETRRLLSFSIAILIRRRKGPKHLRYFRTVYAHRRLPTIKVNQLREVVPNCLGMTIKSASRPAYTAFAQCLLYRLSRQLVAIRPLAIPPTMFPPML